MFRAPRTFHAAQRAVGTAPRTIRAAQRTGYRPRATAHRPFGLSKAPPMDRPSAKNASQRRLSLSALGALTSIGLAFSSAIAGAGAPPPVVMAQLNH